MLSKTIPAPMLAEIRSTGECTIPLGTVVSLHDPFGIGIADNVHGGTFSTGDNYQQNNPSGWWTANASLSSTSKFAYGTTNGGTASLSIQTNAAHGILFQVSGGLFITNTFYK
jgi:hypothetical protein